MSLRSGTVCAVMVSVPFAGVRAAGPFFIAAVILGFVCINEIPDLPHGQIPDVIRCDGRIQSLKFEVRAVFSKRKSFAVGTVNFFYVARVAADVGMSCCAGLYGFKDLAGLFLIAARYGDSHYSSVCQISFYGLFGKKLLKGVAVIHVPDVQLLCKLLTVAVEVLYGDHPVEPVNTQLKGWVDVYADICGGREVQPDPAGRDGAKRKAAAAAARRAGKECLFFLFIC